jgi:site-specific recombinase XerD
MGSFPHRPFAPERRCLPIEEWPAKDRDAWKTILCRAGFLEQASPASAWASDSRRSVAKSYGRLVGWLASRGRLDHDLGPLDRLVPTMLAEFIQDISTLNAAGTVITRLIHLEMLARALAPTRDWSFLRQWQRRLEPDTRDVSRKLRRLRRTDECVELGFKLMQQARFKGTAPASWRQSVLYRDGFMLALLALRPLRLGNFAGLTLERHVLQRAGAWWIHIPKTETKARRRAINEPFPECLVQPLERYLQHVRPALIAHRPGKADSHGARLWVASGGRPLPDRRVHGLIGARTKAAFGQPMNPHLFRDAAATTYAIAAPELVRDAAALLGHADFRTTEAYYRLSQSVAACRAHQKILEQLTGSKREGSR